MSCHSQTSGFYVPNYVSSFELALRGHDETDSSSNPGVFRGLINFSAELDNSLKTHLENSTVFKGTSKTIQNELLAVMLEVCREEISRQIKAANFLAVFADETSDVSNKFQMVVIYRYIHNNKPVESFWDFIVPTGHDAPSLAKSITYELDRHLGACRRKLIAQTYDGASVMSCSLRGVQPLVKQTYPDVAYVHRYAHQLNLIMQNAKCRISESQWEYSKKRRIEDNSKRRNQEAKEICDIIVQQAKSRFVIEGHLSAAMLFLPDRFSEYSTDFPENHLQIAYTNYNVLDMKKFRTELTAIYEREELRKITGALSMFDFINENNLNEAFSESVKLLKALLTIPMTTSKAERSFSTLKRIKTFQRNTMTQERLSALAMLSVERDLIMQIPDFNQRVIENLHPARIGEWIFSSNSIRRPEFECSGPQLEGPEFECSGPQLEGPEFEYSELSLKPWMRSLAGREFESFPALKDFREENEETLRELDEINEEFVKHLDYMRV
ncbi:hypothetical protein ANN_06891 [Periplaneta americana]|uniref:Uncharacterized protein n=1 Tax=Periplaneta americana TaxID=6978 RepID=A0ABQ8TFI4_PERAM|nr:hypothetical protein ANN_06891 [Periplaneta americana]